MDKKQNFLLFGLGTLKNKGCEALLDVISSQIKERNKKNNVVVATDDYYHDKKYHLNVVDKYVSHCIQRLPEGLSDEDKEAISYAENSPFDYKNYEKVYQKQVINEISNTDILFSSGGDNYCYGASEWLYTIDYYAKENNKKLVLLGASIQEENLDDEFLIDLKRFDLLVFRETLSYNLVARFIEKEKLMLLPDPAFSLPIEEIDVDILENTVAINVSPIIERANENALESVYGLIDYILENNKFNVLLLPHVYTDECNDLDTLNKIKEHYNNDSRVQILNTNREYSARQLKYIISKCRFVVASRTHASIAAYSSSVPALVIGYSVKSKGIATDLFGDYKDYVIPVNQLTEYNLIDKFNFMVKNEEKIIEILKKKSSLYKEKSDHLLNTVIEFVNKTSKKENDKYSYENRKVFACKNKSDEVRLNSTSGGVFKELAEYTIKRGGCVYGAAFIDANVKHIRIEDESDMHMLQGSKYVESDLGDIFKCVKKDLDSNIKVLFSGTPCQVGALYSYLKYDPENLLTVSVICHGVPSKRVFKKYIEYFEKNNKDELLCIKMRNKNKSIKGFNSKYIFKNKEFELSSDKDIYYQAFLKNLTLRESCFDCKFKLYGKSKSDFILGDYWGVDKVLPNFNDGYGVSAVITNSDRGNKVFDNIKDNFFVEETGIKNVLKCNPTLISSVKYSLEHYYFLEYLDEMDVIPAMKLALENVKNKELKGRNKELENDIKFKLSRLQELEQRYKQVNDNLQSILSSKRFKMIDKFGNLYNKLKYALKGGK